MAKALAAGIAKSAEQTINFSISDPCDAACVSFVELIGKPHNVTRVESNQDLADSSELIFLAVKPQYLNDALENIEFQHSPLICSIVAGIRTIELERLTGTQRIIRAATQTGRSCIYEQCWPSRYCFCKAKDASLRSTLFGWSIGDDR